jgi:hypothetical protein
VKDLQVFEQKFHGDDLGNFSTTSFQPFHFSCKTGCNSVSDSKLVSEMRNICHCQAKNFLSIQRQYSARSFSASQGRICFLPTFGYTASPEIFYRSLTHRYSVVCGTLKTLDAL